jgi:hypothetical protein
MGTVRMVKTNIGDAAAARRRKLPNERDLGWPRRVPPSIRCDPAWIHLWTVDQSAAIKRLRDAGWLDADEIDGWRFLLER